MDTLELIACLRLKADGWQVAFCETVPAEDYQEYTALSTHIPDMLVHCLWYSDLPKDRTAVNAQILALALDRWLESQNSDWYREIGGIEL